MYGSIRLNTRWKRRVPDPHACRQGGYVHRFRVYRFPSGSRFVRRSLGLGLTLLKSIIYVEYTNVYLKMMGQ
jgi:hypothetical protein